MADKIQFRRDLAANWTSANPVLAQGELGYELDTNRVKLGDGTTPWNSLGYSFEASDHGALSGLGDDDHPQYLNESRHDGLPQDNPHNVTASQVGLGNVDNTSDADKPISTATQAALDLKYDASNPNGYETPAQLNARDAANRDRNNHTGTQTSATISDFPAAVAANETVTTLSLAANTLTYVNEAGTTVNLDLSVYLDDTNLARLVSGTLDSGTGIATFTRDDSSTFTVDLSSLLDNQNASQVPVTPTGNLASTDVQAALEEHQTDIDNLNAADTSLQSQITANDGDIATNAGNIATNTGNISTNSTDIATNQGNITTNANNIASNDTDISNLQAEQTTQNNAIALNTSKVSADGPVSTHSDVNTTGVQTGDQLEWNGSQWVPKAILNGFTVFPIWAEENGGLGNNQYEWSWGNGATGAGIGIPLGLDCELFAVSFNAETFGTSVSINVQADGTTIQTPVFTANNTVQNFTAIPLTQGQRIGFQTNTVNGGMNDARVCAWFRVQATAAFPTPDRDTATITGSNFVSTTFANIPGLTANVTLSSAGQIDGIINYSAARSGGTNSEAQFRVVINGNNGQAFNDTLSTFNDNGSAAHFVSSLPAGNYTVTAQAAVSQPIDIAVATLTATAVES